MIGAAELLEAALRLAPGSTPVASRGASPALRHLVTRHGGAIAPTLRGVAVWSALTAAPVVALVEEPNWLGCTETTPSQPFVAARHDEPGPRWGERVRAGRKLAKTLGQLPGVFPAHRGAGPWFVVGTPVAGERIAAGAAADGLEGVTALGMHFPDIPGGIRVEPPHPLPAAWAAACVASVRRAIAEETPRS